MIHSFTTVVQLKDHINQCDPKPRSIEVDASTLGLATQDQLTYNYNEDVEGTQSISLYVRNGHLVFKGVELILIK